MPAGRPRLADANERHPLYPEWLRIRRHPGVPVCERWQHFRSFAADMGKRPSKSARVVRIDPAGAFDPFNAIWSTAPGGKYDRLLISWGGRLASVSQWSRELGVPLKVFEMRLRRWPIDRLMTTAYPR